MNGRSSDSPSSAASTDNAARRITTIQRHVTSPTFAVSTSAKAMQELADERARASFLVRQMTLYLDGGEQRTKYREDAMQTLAKYPEFLTTDEYNLTPAEQREAVLRKVRRGYQILLQAGSNVEMRNAIAETMGVYDFTMWVRNGVHFGLFMGAILGQGDKEQHDEWLVPLMTLQMFGSFSMTELGHGSHTRGLETTATFDHDTDEFVIHTPTDTATKWWIGAAGQTATHTVVFAQLLINGERKGLQSFVVPLRAPSTHAPLPGVRIGDCGPKLGLHGVDNGWIQFDNCRVPRFNMLRRYASVSREGAFTMHAKPQMAYAALIGTRGKLITLSVGQIKKALTIAVRYCAIRRQGDQIKMHATHRETKLLDYQSHQYRLMPLIARAYAYHFQTSYIESLITKFEESGADMDVQLLADIHGTMAGLKAFATWDVLQAIEECRQCCGGTGYAAQSGLAKTLTDFSVIVTFEGDNTVMAQQTGSYVLKAVDAMRNGQPLSGSVRYLVDAKDTTEWTAVRMPQDALKLENLVTAIRFYASRQVLFLASQMDTAMQVWETREQAWAQCQVEAIESARVHVFYNVASRFIDEVTELKSKAAGNPKQAPLVPVLETLCQLFILYEFDCSASKAFLKHGFMTPQQCDWVRAHVVALCERVRDEAVPLVDAFNLFDNVLNSTIGSANGDIYQNILKVTAASEGKRAPYFDAQIKPMLDGEMFQELEEDN